MKSLKHLFGEITTELLQNLPEDERELLAYRPSNYALNESKTAFKAHMFFLGVLTLLAMANGYKDFENDYIFFIAIISYSKLYTDTRTEKLQVEHHWKMYLFKARVIDYAKSRRISIEDLPE